MDETRPDLRTSADAFFEVGKQLHEAMQGANRPSHKTRVEVAQLAADSVAVARMIDGLRPAVVELWREREGAAASQMIQMVAFGGSIADPPVGPLTVLIKALFLFLRAYQDAMYSLIFEMVTEKRPANARMQHAVTRPESVVGKVLSERLKGYDDWFAGVRELRNAIKTGASFSLLGPPEDIGVMFTSTTDAGEYVMFDVDAPLVRLSHLASAFDVSAALTHMTHELWSDLQSRHRQAPS
jgi:hypothetical protein